MEQSVSDSTTASLRGKALRGRAAQRHPERRRLPRREDWKGYTLRRLLVGADVLALCVSFAAAETYGALTPAGDTQFGKDLLLFAVGLPVWLLFAYAHNLYHVHSRRADHGLAEEIGPIFQMATAWTWCMVLAVSLADIAKVPIEQLALFWLVSIAAVAVFRAAARAWSRRRPWYVENALVVGASRRVEDTVNRIRRHPEYGINVVACVDPSGPGSPERLRDERLGRFNSVPILHEEGDLVPTIHDLDIDRVIVAWSPDSTEERFEMLETLADTGVHVDVVPGWFELLGLKLELHQMEGAPLLRLPSRTLSRSSVVIKRAFDIAVSGAALVLLAPLFAVCALAIKLESRGPVLFRQLRIGKQGKPFELLKFRSMKHGADREKDVVAELNFHGGGTEGGMFKIRRDPRVTRAGYVLRRTSLDELPQLINVLKGDMSLVGPRPLIEDEDRQIEGRLRRRLALSPGLTGLWQAHGRSDIPFETMLNLDYLYATSWSMWGDVKILIRTASTVVRGKGAY